MQMLAESGFDTAHRIYRRLWRWNLNNAGRDVQEARDDAVKAGVTINGLAITSTIIRYRGLMHMCSPQEV